MEAPIRHRNQRLCGTGAANIGSLNGGGAPPPDADVLVDNTKWYADCCIAVKYFSKNFNLNLIDGDTVFAVAIGIVIALGGDELLPDSAID